MSESKISESSTTEGLPVSVSIGPSLKAEHFSKRKGVVDKRALYLCWVAIVIAFAIGLIAKILVLLIGLFTNISFYGTFSTVFSSPAGNHLGAWVIIVPVIGGLIVGVMARFGSKAIRGHGIPEAMEQVLKNESRIPPTITFLKPFSAAISIGTGGPFGAEGPIIATGGALGSLLGQLLKTSADERKILLAAGAAAGMSAIFGSPVSAILLAIELLLFEFSPRSIIPVALACVTGAGIHFYFDGTEPIFSMPVLEAVSSGGLISYTIIGILIGVIAVFATRIVYLIEDGFEKLPIHWMWWPAIGGLAVGVIGYFEPLTMGVGYDNIKNILSGSLSLQVLLSLCFLKFISWSIALGSGTSGGTLAPLLTIGGASGALIGLSLNFLFPELGINIGMAALVGMAATFAGASRALLTSIVFAFETTLQPNAMLPILAGCSVSYLISFLLMKHSIMTEKIERRGIKVPNVYGPNHFENATVSDAIIKNIETINENALIAHTRDWISKLPKENASAAFAVIKENGTLKGVITFGEIFNEEKNVSEKITLCQIEEYFYVKHDAPLNEAIKKLTETHLEILPVINNSEEKLLLGVVTHKSILSAYNNAESKIHHATRTISINQKKNKNS